MRFTLTFTAGALRDLESLPGPIAWAVIAFSDGALSESPRPAKVDVTESPIRIGG